MKRRVFQYNKAIIYLGELDQNALGLKIKEIIDSLPIYINKLPRQDEINIYNFDNNQIITINFNFYLVKNVLSEKESEELLDTLESDLTNTINQELKNQKLIYTIE